MRIMPILMRCKPIVDIDTDGLWLDENMAFSAFTDEASTGISDYVVL